MKKRGSIVLTLVGCLCLILLGGQAKAVESVDSLGGNNAADYQPPTDNPQNVPSSNLQTTTTGLQPVSGQQKVDQQNLNGVSNLQVLGTQGGETNANTTTIAAAKEEKNWLRPIGVIAGIAAIFAVGYALIRSPKPKSMPSQMASAETADNESPLITTQLHKKVKKSQAKKLPKKKTAKKRKTKK